jgi:hypothetical protein
MAGDSPSQTGQVFPDFLFIPQRLSEYPQKPAALLQDCSVDLAGYAA